MRSDVRFGDVPVKIWAVHATLQGGRLYATLSRGGAGTFTSPSTRRGTARSSVPCASSIYTPCTTLPSGKKRLVQIFTSFPAVSTCGTCTFFSSVVALQDRRRGADWEGARGVREQCGGVSCNGTYVRASVIWIWARAGGWVCERLCVTGLPDWFCLSGYLMYTICKQGGTVKGRVAELRLKRVGGCVGLRACRLWHHVDVCVCLCVCWLLCLLAVQRSDIDYKVVAWGAAFAVEVAQNGSRR